MQHDGTTWLVAWWSNDAAAQDRRNGPAAR
jgi:hypothetical protein